jgi:hypothetical protein
MSKGILQRVAAMAVCVACLSACGKSPPPAPPPRLLTPQEAVQRNTVPFTRPIALDKAGTVADVTFDLPPAGSGSIPELMVGMRIRAADAKSMLADRDRIIQGGLASRVRLERVQGPVETAIPLTYASRDLVRTVPVRSDGLIPYVTSIGPRTSLLRTVGLIDENVVYGSLNFASMAPAEPGRYRLSVELLADRPELRGLDIELVVGYAGRAK